MLLSFRSELEKAKIAEKIVLDTFTSLAPGYTFEDVSDIKEYFYKGDIKAVAADGREIFIEVKDDSRIGSTQKILCEEEVYIKEADYFTPGNMSCDGDIYCVVCQEKRKIYVLDYKRLREIYKKGEFKMIEHPQQITHCYLLELCRAKQWGALINVVEY